MDRSQLVSAKSDKGKRGGSCNRITCQALGAEWFNHSTCAHYCGSCARAINEANRADAMRLYGHDLCTREPSP